MRILVGAMLYLTLSAALANPWYGRGPAQSPYAPPQQPAQTQVPPPLAVVQGGMDKLLSRLARGGDPSTLQDFLDREIAPLFDFEYMAKYAAGPLLRHMTDAQRTRMASEIRQMFLRTMAEKLTGYSGQQVRYLGTRPGRDGRSAEVGVAVLDPGRYPSRISFNLYRSGDAWRVYDVVANGQSAVIFYRRHFMRLMQPGSQRGYMRPY